MNAMGGKFEWDNIPNIGGRPSNEQQRHIQNALTKDMGPAKEMINQEMSFKQKIQKMGVEDLNRNTRFFKDYLMDAKKENKKAKIKKKKSSISRIFSNAKEDDENSVKKSEEEDPLAELAREKARLF